MTRFSIPSISKGQPFHFLLILFGFWISMRIIVAASTDSTVHLSPFIDLTPLSVETTTSVSERILPARTGITAIALRKTSPTPILPKLRSYSGKPDIPVSTAIGSANKHLSRSGNTRAVVTHHLLLFSHAMNHRNKFLGNQIHKPAIFQQSYLPGQHKSQKEQPIDRWSLSAWAYARAGEVPSALATGGQYGGGQAGAILSYQISKSRRSSLNVYGRISSAFANKNEEEIAVGSRWHPSTSLPISLSVEQRFRTNRKSETAVFVAGGFGPANLVGGFKLETYGQAGIVGIKSRTHFFDAALTIEKRIARVGKSSIALGAGAWVGGQDNVARLDVGPRATFRLPLPNVATAKLSLDWRQRVMGSAVPDSGPAVTLSTQF